MTRRRQEFHYQWRTNSLWLVPMLCVAGAVVARRSP